MTTVEVLWLGRLEVVFSSRWRKAEVTATSDKQRLKIVESRSVRVVGQEILAREAPPAQERVHRVKWYATRSASVVDPLSIPSGPMAMSRPHRVETPTWH